MLDLIRDFLKFAREYRKFWMIPFMVLLLLVGGVIFLTSSTTIAPFIYALF